MYGVRKLFGACCYRTKPPGTSESQTQVMPWVLPPGMERQRSDDTPPYQRLSVH